MSRRWTVPCIGAFLSLAFSSQSIVWSQCSEWKNGFGLPGGGVSGSVTAQAIYDDGSGPALFVGGSFTSAGEWVTNNIARWNGTSWSSLGSGLDGGVNALFALDTGSGQVLYAGGYFTHAGGVPANHIARWNGSSWSALGSGMSINTGFSPYVDALAAFDDGSGMALYAGGYFGTAGGVVVSSIAKWNGSNWSPLGSGMDGSVGALTVFDDGGGLALYAGGQFTTAGGVAANGIAKWNGSSWSPLGSGARFIDALTVFDDGGGSALYAGGGFTSAGGVAAIGIAQWNGSSWSALGSGVDESVNVLTVFNDGSGPALYAGGWFDTAGGVAASHIAKWNGSSWFPLGSGINAGVTALTVFDDGGGRRLYAGGYFGIAGDVAANNIADWNGSVWVPLASLPGNGMNDSVDALAVFDDGSGLALYAGGSFATAGGVVASHIARWNGLIWSPVGSGIDGPVHALTVFDDGSGPALYAGGSFTVAGGVSANSIARWNGSAWSALGSGINGSVVTLSVFDDGSGAALYAGPSVGFPVRWNGSSWISLAGAFDDFWVQALAGFDDGSGPALYAGGAFVPQGYYDAYHILRWNGVGWGSVGGWSTDPSWYPGVKALRVFDDGTGPALYAGGYFVNAGTGVPANFIAKWNGSIWSPLSSELNGAVTALAVFDDPAGSVLYAAGSFTSARGVSANLIAMWNGLSWSPLGDGLSDPSFAYPQVSALAVFDDPASHSPDVYAAGTFTTAGGRHSSNIAEWRACAITGVTFCFGDSMLAPCPCTPGLSGRGCDNSAATGGAQLLASGSTRPDRVVLHTTGELPTALSIFFQGSASVVPAVFSGAGLRCIGGTFERLYAKNAVGGSSSAPSADDPGIREMSATLGDPIAAGSSRYYQTYYRDPDPNYCPPPFGDSWNLTNGLRIIW